MSSPPSRGPLNRREFLHARALALGGLKVAGVRRARPCTPKDILATTYPHLGIEPKHSFADPSGRPVPILGEGGPIAELI